MKTTICGLLLFLITVATAVSANHAPEIQNGNAQQRPGTYLVNLTFDLVDADGDTLSVAVEASDDEGNNWDIIPSTITGDVGAGISPGNGKQIVWDIGADLPDVQNSNFHVRLSVSDGQFTMPADMAFIPAGEFEMGDHFNEGNSDERPVHTVYLDAFYMDKYEVTNAQYVEFLNDYGKNEDSEGHEMLDLDDDDCLIEESGGVYRPMSGYENHPVIEVSWYGAVAYAEYYGKRLPTEAEWEKAARGGLVGKRYPWGDSISHDDANYRGTGGTDQWRETAPVGSFPPNGYGLYDIAGNVWEWCADWYDSNYYSSSPYANPHGPGTGSFRLLRGCSWSNITRSIRVATRSDYDPYNTNGIIGFRCCVSQDLTPSSLYPFTRSTKSMQT